MTTHTVLRACSALGLTLFLGAGCMRQPPEPPAPVRPAATAEAPQEAPEPSVKAAAYVRLTGVSRVMVTRGTKQAEAADGTALEAGDQIEVISGSATLSYPETGASRLEKGSKVEIVADTGSKGMFMRIRLMGGTIWTRLQRLLGPEEHLSVEANGVVATVRGTAFGVLSLPGGADILVVESSVEVAAAGGESDLPHVLTVMPGRAAKIASKEEFRKEGVAFQTLVRLISVAEMSVEGYQFAKNALDPSYLKVPTSPVKLSVASAERNAFIDQLRNLQATVAKRRAIDLNATFVSPTAAPTTTGGVRPGR